MTQLTLCCLGPFQAALDGIALTHFHSIKVQALLAYLALEADRPHSREALATQLWPLDNETSARNSLRQALYELRKMLGDRDDLAHPFLLVTRQTVQFNCASDYTLDVADFLAHVKQDQLEQAAALYRGDLLTGLSCESEPFEEWSRLARAHFHNLAVDVCFKLTNQALQQGNLPQARTYAERQLALEPWREEAHRQLMTALALAGERSAALAQFETCRQMLAEELGVAPDSETTTIYEQIKAAKLRSQPTRLSPATFGLGKEALAVAPPARHNLPPQPTPFIGRQRDLAQLAARLTDPNCRLLTIVGPGGMGKTRLAIRTAQLSAESEPHSCADGVFFVALAGVGSPALLVSTIASTLDFTFYASSDPKIQLLDYLKPRTLLLVLDNCEHLLDGIELVSEILAAGPGVKILATSREPLNLREEWLHPLSGMSFPAEAIVALTADQSSGYSAVQLFTQCARQLKPDFDLAAEGNAVAQICRLVEGMPLSIELAAAWIKFYPCGQIAQEVARNLDFLATTLRNVPARHRSIRALFEHSWSLLTEHEQQVFARLAIFRGGLQQEAAQQVADAFLPILLALVEKSLLQLSPDGRFRLHELLRQFAHEKLQAQPQALAQTQARHSIYYLSFLQRQETLLKGKEHRTAMTTVEAEIENIRSAWQWVVGRGLVDEIGHSLNSLFAFYLLRSWFQEGENLFRQAADALRMDKPTGKPGIVFAKLLVAQGQLQYWSYTEMEEQVSREATIALLEEGLAILRRLGAHGETGNVLDCLGKILCWAGDFERGLQLSQEALAVFAEQRDLWGMSRVLLELGFFNFWLGAYQEALQYLHQGVALCEARGDLRTLGDILNIMGDVYNGLGDYEETRKVIQAAMTALTAVGDKRGVAWSLQLLGEVAWHLGDYATAQQHAEDSLALFQEIGLVRPQDAPLNVLGHIACSLGNYAQAKTYFCRVLAPPLCTGTLTHYWTLAEALRGLATVLMHEGKVEQAAELFHHVLRHPAAWQDTKARTQRQLTELAAELPPQLIVAAQARAAAQNLTTIVATLLAEFEQ